jgi:hypothetical protein
VNPDAKTCPFCGHDLAPATAATEGHALTGEQAVADARARRTA